MNSRRPFRFYLSPVREVDVFTHKKTPDTALSLQESILLRPEEGGASGTRGTIDPTETGNYSLPVLLILVLNLEPVGPSTVVTVVFSRPVEHDLFHPRWCQGRTPSSTGEDRAGVPE